MKYDFDNLVLLVGTNPLPNLVVADFFLKKNPSLHTLWLIHSEEKGAFQAGTAHLAQNLETILRARWQDRTPETLRFNKVPLSDVSNAKSIRRNADQKLFEKLNDENKIHLNYTGGTKSMSTHIYWLLKEREKKDTITFSYLDARNFSLVEDKDDVIAADLRKMVSLKLDELIRLHGFERTNKDKLDAFPATTQLFESIIEDNMLDQFVYKPGSGGFDRNLFMDKKGDLAKKAKDIENQDCLRSFRPNETFRKVVASMPEQYRIFNASGMFRCDMSDDSLKSALKYLDGGWLEQYVAKTVEDGFPGSPLDIIEGNETGGNSLCITKNIVIKKPDWNSGEKFELDVVVLNGYQPTGISCTTMDRKNGCKLKGFEIIHRTRQIGGDEAKAVLVCFLQEKTKIQLQTELAYHTGGSKVNILVLGRADISKKILARRLREFILEN